MKTPPLPVPQYAKDAAKRGLKSEAGLTKEEAKSSGINSGRARARQIIRSNSIPFADAKRVCAFKRFLGMKQTKKVKAAIDLWGGEKFIKKACEHVKKHGG